MGEQLGPLSWMDFWKGWRADRQRHKSTSSTNQEKSSSFNGLDRRFSQSLCDLNSITIRPKSGKVDSLEGRWRRFLRRVLGGGTRGKMEKKRKKQHTGRQLFEGVEHRESISSSNPQTSHTLASTLSINMVQHII